MYVGKLKEKIFEEKKCVEKCQKSGSSTAFQEKVKNRIREIQFFGMV